MRIRGSAFMEAIHLRLKEYTTLIQTFPSCMLPQAIFLVTLKQSGSSEKHFHAHPSTLIT